MYTQGTDYQTGATTTNYSTQQYNYQYQYQMPTTQTTTTTTKQVTTTQPITYTQQFTTSQPITPKPLPNKLIPPVVFLKLTQLPYLKLILLQPLLQSQPTLNLFLVLLLVPFQVILLAFPDILQPLLQLLLQFQPILPLLPLLFLE